MRNTYGSLLVAALAAMAWGCGEPKNQAIQTRVALEAFENCAELEEYIEDTAVRDMTSQLEQLKEYGGGWWWAAAEDAAGGPTSNGYRSSPSAYTTTNTQVAGVDEADFVKNDGTRLFVLSGNTLYLNRSWPANVLATTAKVEIEGYPREMFLEGNDVVVFSGVYQARNVAGEPAADVCTSGFWCGYYYTNNLKITLIDVSDLAAPKVKGELYLPGGYLNSRRIGSSVRVVTSDAFRWPVGMKWWPDYEAGLWEDRALLAAAIDKLIDENEDRIRAQDLKDWLPDGLYVNPADGSTHAIGYQCTEFTRANAPTKLGLLSVVTLNLDAETLAAQHGPQLSRVSIIGEPGVVYASPTSLYVASSHWWWWPEPGQSTYTYVHKFDLTDPDTAVHVASGGIEGTIVDQFSMDEHEGYLRMATTIARRVPDPQNRQNIWGVLEFTNRIGVLGENSGELRLVGRSEELAKGERIMSSRFIGPKAFVVTFRSVDPLFTFDVSDPTAPRRVGELKIPGFSTYIHPLDADHLLTIGEHRDENGGWGSRSLKLSIFDVSDFANPKEKFTQLVGSASAYSDALWDHKAFNYFAARGLLAIPYTDYDYAYTGDQFWNGFISELRVFGVSTATGFDPKGAIAMDDLYQAHTYTWGNGETFTWYWSPAVRRSVMADEFVYAISDAGIRVADVANLASPLKTVLFDRVQVR